MFEEASVRSQLISNMFYYNIRIRCLCLLYLLYVRYKINICIYIIIYIIIYI